MSVFLQTPFDERWGQFEPDGRIVACLSNESARHEICVRPFAPPAAWRGGQPRRAPVAGLDGWELVYLDTAGRMSAALITLTQNWQPDTKP